MGEKTMPITGGCLCGAVRYESSEQPSDSNYCHCGGSRGTCLKSSGAPVTAFRFTPGEPRFYKSAERVSARAVDCD